MYFILFILFRQEREEKKFEFTNNTYVKVFSLL